MFHKNNSVGPADSPSPSIDDDDRIRSVSFLSDDDDKPSVTHSNSRLISSNKNPTKSSLYRAKSNKQSAAPIHTRSNNTAKNQRRKGPAPSDDGPQSVPIIQHEEKVISYFFAIQLL